MILPKYMTDSKQWHLSMFVLSVRVGKNQRTSLCCLMYRMFAFKALTLMQEAWQRQNSRNVQNTVISIYQKALSVASHYLPLAQSACFQHQQLRKKHCGLCMLIQGILQLLQLHLVRSKSASCPIPKVSLNNQWYLHLLSNRVVW